MYVLAVAVVNAQKAIVAKIARPKYQINLVIGSSMQVGSPKISPRTFLSLSVGGELLNESEIEPDIFFFQSFIRKD